jgi:ATP-binding cassette subfamily B (MDR/TAP) protein 1
MAVAVGGEDVPNGPNIESLIHRNTSVSSSVQVSSNDASSYWSIYQFATTKDLSLMAIGVLCAIISGSAQPLSTLVFGELTNVFVDWQRQASVGALVSQADLLASVSKGASYFLILAAVAFVTSYLYTAIFLYTSERQIHSYRKEYLAAVLRQDAQWFDTQGSAGSVSYQLIADIDRIREGLGEKVPGTVQALSTFVSAIVIAFTQSWKLTLALFSIMPIIVATMAVVNVFGARYQSRIPQLYSTASDHAVESLTAIRTVIAFGAQQRMAKRYNSGLTAAREEGIKKSFSLATGLGIVFFLLFSGYSITFYYGAILLELGQITAGQIINVFFAVLIGSFALGHAVPDFQTYSIATVSGHKLQQTLDRVPPIDSLADGEVIPTLELKGHIQVTDVDFTYPSRPDNQVLHGMTLDIQPGTTVALVGESGSGKSTIIQLLERFYNPYNGSITLDGRPIQSLQVKWLRRQIGLVGQEPVLFDGTVAENVAHGLLGSDLDSLSPEAKRELIIQACRQANAHDFILKMPNGYDSHVGERGMLLSGGQKQRLCIARAIVKNPKILLLDEATSALDTTSERIVQAAIEKASKGRTTIVIAHRLSTIRDANQIVVMVRGRITEQGTHNELLDHPDGLYKRLVEAQSVQKEEVNEPEESDDENSASTVAIESFKKPKEDKSPAVSRESTKRSVRSTNTVLSLLGDVEAAERVRYSATKVLLEMLKFSKGQYVYLAVALFAAVLNGMVYPCYSIVFGERLKCG